MCNEVCHTVRENALTMNCSYFQAEAPMHRPSFFSILSLTIKDKTNISLTFKILHLRQGSFTRRVRTIFTLKDYRKYFCETLFNLSFTLTTIFYRKNFCEKGYRPLTNTRDILYNVATICYRVI